MEALRQIVDSAALGNVIKLPQSMIGKKLEIIVIPVENTEKATHKSMKGCMKKYANTELVPMEKGAWERAAAERYDSI